MSYTALEMVRMLTDANRKDEISNNYKLFLIVAKELQALSKTEQEVRFTRCIDNAYGKTLDLIGENIDQPRGKATDEIYRTLLKAKMARNWSVGDFNSTLRLLSFFLNCEPSQFEIEETWEEIEGGESAVISITGMPIAELNRIGMSTTQFVQIVKSIMPIAVRIESLQFDGTFEFGGPDTIEIDNNKGFGNLDGTIGGYFGETFSGTEDIELPV